MHRPRQFRAQLKFRSNPLWNQATTHSFPICAKLVPSVFNRLHTHLALNIELSPVFPSDYALPAEKGGRGYLNFYLTYFHHSTN